MFFHKMLIKTNQEHQNDNSSRMENLLNLDLKHKSQANGFRKVENGIIDDKHFSH